MKKTTTFINIKLLQFPTVGRFCNIVGFILAFGSPFYKPVPKDGSVNIFSGNIFDTNIHFERFFVNIKHN